MAHVNVNQATVLDLPIRSSAAAEAAKPSGSSCSGSVVSDSVVADTNASADACPGEWERCCLSLQQTATSKPFEGHDLAAEDSIVAQDEGRPGLVPCKEPNTGQADAALSGVQQVETSMSGPGDNRAQENDLETTPSHAPEFLHTASQGIRVHPDGQTHEDNAVVLTYACKSDHTRPAASKGLPSPAFSCPACLQAHQLPACLQSSLQQQKRAGLCNTSCEPHESGYLNPSSCKQGLAESQQRPLSQPAQPNAAPITVTAVDSAAALPSTLINAVNTAADVQSHGIPPSRLYAAVEEPVKDPECVPSSALNVEQDFHDTDPCPHEPPQHDPPEASDTLSEHQSALNAIVDSQVRPELGDVLAVRCSTTREPPHKQPATASPRPMNSCEQQEPCLSSTPLLSLPAEQRCTQQECNAGEQTLDVGAQATCGQSLIDPPVVDTGDNTSVSVLCSRVCAAANTPVLCSSLQPISPAQPSATSQQQSVSDQELPNDLHGSPSTPTVRRRLQFSWDSPPAPPARSHVAPRLGCDEGENLPAMAPYLNSDASVLDSPLASPLAEVGSETWIDNHTALDGFSASDTNVSDPLVVPPVLGAARSVQPLRAMEVDRASNSSRGEEKQGDARRLHHQYEAPVPAPLPPSRDCPPAVSNGNESLLTILQKAKSLLETARPMSNACTPPQQSLWRQRGHRAAARMPRLCTLKSMCMLQKRVFDNTHCVARRRARQQAVPALHSLEAPASNSPAPVSTPAQVTETIDPAALAMVSYQSTNNNHKYQDEGTVSGNAKRRISSSNSLQPEKQLPVNVSSSDIALQTPKEAVPPRSIAPQLLEKARGSMFAETRLQLTHTRHKQAAPPPTESQKKMFCGKRLLAAINKGLSSTAVQDISHPARTVTRATENSTAVLLPQRQCANKTVPDVTEDCQKRSIQNPSGVGASSKSDPKPAASSFAVVAASTKRTPRNMLGKRKLRGMLLQQQATAPSSAPEPGVTPSPCERRNTSDHTTCSTDKKLDRAPCVPKSTLIQRDSTVAAALECLSHVRKGLPNAQTHTAPLCAAHKPAGGPGLKEPHSDTKQALAQKPLSTAQTPMKPTMSDKSRCVAEHAGKKESASEGYRETRKLRTQTLKRLLESYETSACGTVARVGSQSLSIKDALQLQHKQTDSKLGGTSGDFRMVSTANRFEHHVSHTTAGGKALPESNFRIQANRLNVLEAQSGDDIQRHRQFMAAMYRQLQQNSGAEGSVVPSGRMPMLDTLHSTDPYLHCPNGSASSHLYNFQDQALQLGRGSEARDTKCSPQHSNHVLNTKPVGVVPPEWSDMPAPQHCESEDKGAICPAFGPCGSETSLDDSLPQELHAHDEMLQSHTATVRRAPSHPGTGPSLKDVLKASEQSTVVRLVPTSPSHHKHGSKDHMEGFMECASHDTEQHYAANTTTGAVKKLLQLSNSNMPKSSAGQGGRVAQLQKLLHAIQQSEGSEGDNVSIPSSSCSPAASSRSAETDHKSKRILQQDSTNPDGQPLKQRCKGMFDNKYMRCPHVLEDCGVVPAAQNAMLRQHRCERKHRVSRTQQLSTVLQHIDRMDNSSMTRTEYHCKSVRKETETVVMSCSDIFKGL